MDDKALLAAIHSEPDDDLARLAYADWLDEHDDDVRAEFIRVQVELARTDWADDRHAQLLARGHELEQRRRADWLAGAPPGLLVGEFHRGFPRHVGLPAPHAPRRGLTAEDFGRLDKALALFPLRTLSATLLGAVSPSIQRFPQQSLYPQRGQSPLEQLAAWPGLARFTTLDLGGGRVLAGQGDFQPGVEALAGSPHAAHLDTLRLSGLLLGEDAVTSLADSAHLGRLRSLDVRYNVPLNDRPAVFLQTPLPDRLEEIDGLDLETAGAWLRRPGGRLRALGVTLDPHNDHPEVIDPGPLLGVPGLANLRRLTLHFDGPAVWQDRTPERGEGILVSRLFDLLSSPLLHSLEELDLCGVALGGADLAVLATFPAAQRLVSLRLRRGRLGAVAPAGRDCISAIASLLTGGRLRRLDLSHNYLTNEDALALSRRPELARLHQLRLDSNDLDAAGVALLRESRHRRPWLLVSG